MSNPPKRLSFRRDGQVPGERSVCVEVMDTSAHHIVSRFEHAGLRLKVSDRPLVSVGTDAIVQLDISRARSKHDEGFRLWPGHASNRIEVQGVERARTQLVLMVHEPRRRFEVETSRFAAERTPGARIVRVKGRRAWLEQFTDERKRHFLCGLDEQHCFIAQLPEAVSTVAQAHRALRPAEVDEAEREAKSAAIRQGEFFFVALKEDALKRALQLARHTTPRARVGIAQGAGWRRVGRPHVAEEVWRIETGGASEPIVLVRGTVRHPDHKAVRFSQWVRVFQNREASTPPAGVLWVD